MNAKESTARPAHAQRGFGLVETMVGLVIGLIAVLVIYQVFNVSEAFKRNTTAAGEAQSTGLFATFMLGLEIGNGGAAMAVSGTDLAVCPDTGNIATSLRPIPVLITDGGGGTVDPSPDSFVVNYSISPTLHSPAMFDYKDPVAKVTSYAAGDAFNIQSPGGFQVGDLVVGINPAIPDCAASKVTAVSAPDVQLVDLYGTPTNVSVVTITHTAVGIGFEGDGRPGLSTLFNMGPANRAQKIMYQLCDQRTGCPQPPTCGVGAPCTLESVPLLDANGVPLVSPAGNPLASNIVNMKVEYGIDSDLDQLGLLDTWVQATTGGGWTPADVLPAPLKKINQIKAIRIGIIVQSEQFDQTLGDYSWVMFDCSNVNKLLCPGRLTGSIPASVAPAGNWRFRKYETVIPIRNEIWNKAS